MCDNIEEGITTDHNIENFFFFFFVKEKTLERKEMGLEKK